MEDIFPNKLKYFRFKSTLTQKQVIEELGLQCQDRLSHWETGRAMPNVPNLLRLAELYGVDLVEITRT